MDLNNQINSILYCPVRHGFYENNWETEKTLPISKI